MTYGDTQRALDDLTDDRAFEKLATLLLTRTGMNLRPIGGPGDRGRDAVAGLSRSDGGEELAVAVSLERDWPGKVRRDLHRIWSQGLRPRSIVFVTNRNAPPTRQTDLQRWAKATYNVDLTIHDQRWLVARLYLRDNLDLRREFLRLKPPRPHFLLDLSEYQALLGRRNLFDTSFTGREGETQALERNLAEHRSAVLEAPGGFGKSRLVFEHAASGRSGTPWFFVDSALPFEPAYLAEAEEGYEVTIFIDDAHRRRDLGALLGALERRQPLPQLVFAVRPGHVSAVESALSGLALPEPDTILLGTLGRSDLAAILRAEPFRLERDAMVASIIELSEGNVGIAVLAGGLAAQGADPRDLSKADVFRKHVDSRLRGAGLDSRVNRQFLALIAGLGLIDFTDTADVAIGADLLGVSEGELHRKIDHLADAGLIVEQSPEQYALKPDIVREHVQRFSFFPAEGKPVLRYARLYDVFHHRRDQLLTALGESGAETATSAGPTLELVRRNLGGSLAAATTFDQLHEVAARARRLCPGASGVATELAAGLIEKFDDLDAAHVDQLAPAVVDVLAAAKFGRDRFPEAWGLLLRLARRVQRPGLSVAYQAASKEITEIFGSAPMNYSSRDFEVLGYIQDVVRSESEKWWAEEGELPGASAVAALLVDPGFTLQLEQHRQSAGDAMAINLVAGFVPPWEPTAKLLKLGAELFQATFIALPPLEQMRQLELVHGLAGVAGGYPGMFSTTPDDELQELAESVLLGIEGWLVEHLDEMTLPIAAAAFAQLRGRRVRVGGKPARSKIALPRPKGDLRGYLDLVDSHRRQVRMRRTWQKELERRARVVPDTGRESRSHRTH
jgi:hypothetical protein